MGFFDILTKPQLTMEAEKPKADLAAALKTYALYGAILGLILGIVIAVALNAFELFLGFPQQVPLLSTTFAGLGYLAIIVVPILMLLWAVLGAAIGYGILWLVSKLLGGTGTFTENYFLGSRLLWPQFIAGIAVSILGRIPFIGWLLTLLWFLFVLYLLVILLSVANNISKGKAVIMVVIIGVIAVLAALVAASLVGAWIASGAYKAA